MPISQWLQLIHLFEGFAFEGSMFLKAFGFYCFSFLFSLFAGFACKINHHAVRHVRAAACRTTDKFGSPNQQQGVEKYCW
jgi:hypothetical protein